MRDCTRCALSRTENAPACTKIRPAGDSTGTAATVRDEVGICVLAISPATTSDVGADGGNAAVCVSTIGPATTLGAGIGGGNASPCVSTIGPATMLVARAEGDKTGAA